MVTWFCSVMRLVSDLQNLSVSKSVLWKVKKIFGVRVSVGSYSSDDESPINPISLIASTSVDSNQRRLF